MVYHQLSLDAARTLMPHGGGTAQWSLSQEMSSCCRHATEPESALVPCVFWLLVCEGALVLVVFGGVL